MFGQIQLSNLFKIELFEVISNLMDLSVVENCIEFGKAVLLQVNDNKMRMAVYWLVTDNKNGFTYHIFSQIHFHRFF